MRTIGLAELEARVREDSIDTVLAVMPDLQGRLAGKRYTGRSFLSHARHGWHGCDYLLGCDIENEPLAGFGYTSWEGGYGDLCVVPDLDTLVPVPWLERTALVLGDVVGHDGRAVEIAPREILRAQLRRARERGIAVRLASELEFYLFRDSFDQAGRGGYRDLAPAGRYIQDYHILQTTRDEGVMQPLRRHLDALGLEVECTKGEWGPGQMEINLAHAEPLAMADRHALLKHAVKEVAHLAGHSATFMAKWHDDHAGSSCHIHSSIWDAATGEPLGWAPEEPGRISARFGHWIAGQLALAPVLSVLYAPYPNSYRRYQAGSFAPTRLAVGRDNRTCAFRLVGGSPAAVRVENRCPGADANPYLAFAATLAAGIYGLDHELPLPDLYRGNAYRDDALPRLPGTLWRAAELFHHSPAARESFGDAIVDHYTNLARQEQAVHDRRVTDVDLRRYFERA